MRTTWVETGLLLALAVTGVLEGYAALGRRAFQQEPVPPGTYLIAVSVAMGAITLVYLIGARRAGPPTARPGGFKLGSQARVWAVMVGYALMLPVLGYALATLTFFWAALLVLGVRPWPRAGLASLVFAGVFVAGFVLLANLSLPSGFVGVIMDLLR